MSKVKRILNLAGYQNRVSVELSREHKMTPAAAEALTVMHRDELSTAYEAGRSVVEVAADLVRVHDLDATKEHEIVTLYEVELGGGCEDGGA